MADRRRDDDEERGSRRGREDDEPRGRRGREDDEPRRGRDRDEDDSRDRDRGRERRSREDDDEPRGGGSSYTYERRDPEAMRRRGEGNSDFDRIVSEKVKQWKPNDGDNRIRIIPPTWAKAEHHGLDLKVHYGVGADRQSYLCLRGMKGEDDPIYEAYERARAELNEDEENKELKEHVRNLKAKPRVGIYLVDRDHEKEGVQFWAMPAGLDTDIVQVMQDKRTGEVLPIDDPKKGYDVEFVKKGKGINTEYLGVAIARRSSPLHDDPDKADKWMDFAVANPIPSVLQYFPYEHIAKAFGGGGKKRREDDDRPSRDREERGSTREREEDRGRDREERRPESREREEAPRRGRETDAPTWESVHDMTRSELVDLIEDQKLDIKPKQAKDDEDLADWICEELKIKKPERRREREPDGGEDKLAEMRRRRERD